MQVNAVRQERRNFMENTLNRLMMRLAAGVIVFSMSAVASVKAIPVQYVGASPSQAVTIDVNAFGYTGGANGGVYNLLVNGVPTASFCIDVFRDVNASPQPYSELPLASSPLLPDGPMGAAAALEIQKLWALFDGAALADNSGATAANLQIAIWYAVANGTSPYAFHVVGDSGALAMLAAANSYAGPLPYLVGLDSPDYQNYVVQAPDGGLTVAFLGFAMVGIEGLRRKLGK
jgi:hypothetical protein